MILKAEAVVIMPLERSLMGVRGPQDCETSASKDQHRPFSSSPSSAGDSIPLPYDDQLHELAVQSWLPDFPDLPRPWAAAMYPSQAWDNEVSPLPSHVGLDFPVYPTTQDLGFSIDQFDSQPSSDVNDENRFYQPCSQSLDLLIGPVDQNGNLALKEQQPHIQQHIQYAACISLSEESPQPPFCAYEPEEYRPAPPSAPPSLERWTPIVASNDDGVCCATESFEPFDPPGGPPPTLRSTLDWLINEEDLKYSMASSNSSTESTLTKPKRKSASSRPKAKKTKVAGPSPPPQRELSEFVVVFENAPGALAAVKKRRKLDAPVRKAAKAVRKAGACHQCRFRKRTCSTGTPCNSCLRNGNGLHELKCQRESPFLEKTMHQYFAYSSQKRVVEFDLLISSSSFSTCRSEKVTIDGIGRISHPLSLPARSKILGSFKPEERKLIIATIKANPKTRTVNEDDSLSIIILEENETLGLQVEQWAMEYASKFIVAAGPGFLPTTAAMLLGLEYVKKNLPESPLVAAMTRVSALAFVLRAGVKCSTATPPPPTTFRTIQASIDTILYNRLRLAENDLCTMLQRIVFRSAGYLSRTQVYPVALVFWSLLRFLCLSSSHLHNIVSRFGLGQREKEAAEKQYHALTLVLSTHMALFRSSNPLLLDMSEVGNRDLLVGDEVLIKLAESMRGVVKGFRERGFRDLRGSVAYKKGYFELFRRVYDKM